MKGKQLIAKQLLATTELFCTFLVVVATVFTHLPKVIKLYFKWVQFIVYKPQ